MTRKRTKELTGMAVPGSQRIPYDQTDPMQQVAAPPQAPPQMPGVVPGAPDMGATGGSPSLLAGMGGPPPGGGGNLLGGGVPPGGPMDPGAGGAPLPGDPAMGGAGSTDDLTGNDLAALGQPQDPGTPEDIQVAQLEQILNDPNADPQMVQQVQQMLDLAARRRLAGLGGQAAGGGMMGA